MQKALFPWKICMNLQQTIVLKRKGSTGVDRKFRITNRAHVSHQCGGGKLQMFNVQESSSLPLLAGADGSCNLAASKMHVNRGEGTGFLSLLCLQGTGRRKCYIILLRIDQIHSFYFCQKENSFKITNSPPPFPSPGNMCIIPSVSSRFLLISNSALIH